MENIDFRKVGLAVLALLIVILSLVFLITRGGDESEVTEESVVELVPSPYEGLEEGRDFGAPKIRDGLGELSNGVYIVGYYEDELYDTGITVYRFETVEMREEVTGIVSDEPVVVARYGKTVELGNVPVPRIQAVYDEMVR